MGYQRNSRGYGRDDYGDRRDYGRDYGSDRDYGYSSARDYGAAGRYRDRDGHGERNDRDDYGARGWGRDDDRYTSPYASGGSHDRGYRGSYMSDGRRALDTDRGNRDQYRRGGPRDPRGYDYDDRGFFDRAGDEVRSWFGDDEAERRREMDRRYDERYARDESYGNWRQQRIHELDRDYDEYRRENATKFENEFNSFRTERQTQRECLRRVTEHMEVVGSDGQHVGTVDKVHGDRIILTKSDADAGGRHHSIPSRWIESVDDKVVIRKTADEAKSQWRDEERNNAMFGGDEGNNHGSTNDVDPYGRNLNRSFSGTY
jgi:hypothetical protein